MNQTPLYPVYAKYNAKIIDFHGWALPVQFSSIIQEHQTVRAHVGLFDVSHMGEILVQGPEAAAFLDYALTNRISGLRPGGIRYSPLCYENGGTVDDLLVYSLEPDQFLLVVNASNTTKNLDFLLNASAGYQVSIIDQSKEFALLALQGPKALAVLSELTEYPLADLGYYRFVKELDIAGSKVLISRTGYTGEDGFEMYLPPDQAVRIWEILLEVGNPYGIAPIGLGARDTLRFEAGLPLYGNELTENISPVEAGLERFIKLDKPFFISKEALQKQIENGAPRRLIGVQMIDRGIPRAGYTIFKDGRAIGFVTSGSYCPTLNGNFAMALLETASARPDLEVDIDIRGKFARAKTVQLPFYTRPKGVD
ncbi:MAG: glycine cleavage system aminomethyltransferase GcvT [Firmicutes bacterium]|nr:glycine cleavage system aminomethyltransferase GcvT [Bacillota bacterium]